MLLIHKNILLSPTTAIFEPHIFTMRGSPFILHADIAREGVGIFNLHQNIEFLYVTSGIAEVRYGDRTIEAHAGQIVTVNAHVAHRVTNTQGAVYHCLIPDNSLFGTHDIPVERLCFDTLICDGRACTLFDAILDEHKGGVPFRMAGLHAAILAFLLHMCRHHATERDGQSATEHEAFRRVQSAINYIKKNLAHRITTDELAAHVNLSKYHFLRQFKQITGSTVTEYLHFLRCEYAKHLLGNKERPIKEIAALCGFEDSSYFAKIFKKQSGMTPLEYAALSSQNK